MRSVLPMMRFAAEYVLTSSTGDKPYERPAPARQSQIQNNHVPLAGARDIERLLRVGCFADFGRAGDRGAKCAAARLNTPA